MKEGPAPEDRPLVLPPLFQAPPLLAPGSAGVGAPSRATGRSGRDREPLAKKREVRTAVEGPGEKPGEPIVQNRQRFRRQPVR